MLESFSLTTLLVKTGSVNKILLSVSFTQLIGYWFFKVLTDSESVMMLSTISKFFTFLPEKNHLDFEFRGVYFSKSMIDIGPVHDLKINILVDMNKE